jgi:two-component system OmpR family response regulator
MTTTKIVVVESDRLLRTAIAEYLKRQAYTVLEAADAASALLHLEQGAIQAVLLDTHPAAQGTDLLKQIRNRPALAQLPVIALIASHCNLEALDYLKPGDYLSVPFDMQQLANRLKHLLEGLVSAKPCTANSEPAPTDGLAAPVPVGGSDDGRETHDGQ